MLKEGHITKSCPDSCLAVLDGDYSCEVNTYKGGKYSNDLYSLLSNWQAPWHPENPEHEWEAPFLFAPSIRITGITCLYHISLFEWKTNTLSFPSFPLLTLRNDTPKSRPCDQFSKPFQVNHRNLGLGKDLNGIHSKPEERGLCFRFEQISTLFTPRIKEARECPSLLTFFNKVILYFFRNFLKLRDSCSISRAPLPFTAFEQERVRINGTDLCDSCD